eukprot:1542025-Rhodomonas_salina.1
MICVIGLNGLNNESYDATRPAPASFLPLPRGGAGDTDLEDWEAGAPSSEVSEWRERAPKGIKLQSEPLSQVARTAELIETLDRLEAVLAGTSSTVSVYTMMLSREEVVHKLKSVLGGGDEITEARDRRVVAAKKLMCLELKYLGQMSRHNLYYYFEMKKGHSWFRKQTTP